MAQDTYKQLAKTAASIDEILAAANDNLIDLPYNYVIIGGESGPQLVHRSELQTSSFKGVLTSTTYDPPSPALGDFYRVGLAGTYGNFVDSGDSGIVAEVGDEIWCLGGTPDVWQLAPARSSIIEGQLQANMDANGYQIVNLKNDLTDGRNALPLGKQFFKYHSTYASVAQSGIFLEDVVLGVKITNAESGYDYFLRQIFKDSGGYDTVVLYKRNKDTSVETLITGTDNFGVVSEIMTVMPTMVAAANGALLEITINYDLIPATLVGTASTTKVFIADNYIWPSIPENLNNSVLILDSLNGKETVRGIIENESMINIFPNDGDDGFVTANLVDMTNITPTVAAKPSDCPVPVTNCIHLDWVSGQSIYKIQHTTGLGSWSDGLLIGWWQKATEVFDIYGYAAANWRLMISEDEYKVGYFNEVEYSGFIVRLWIDELVEGYYFIRIQYDYTSAMYAGFLMKFDGTMFDSNGSSDFINFLLIKDPPIYNLSPWIVYRNEVGNSWGERVEQQVAGGSFASIDFVNTQLERYTYGANIANFLKKARDWRAGRVWAKEPKIIILGDSITGGSWASDFKDWMVAQFDISDANIELHWYGGCDTEYMMPFIDDIFINNNPDLVMFNEYESAGTNDERLVLLETIIRLVRERTSADIVIGTWSMSKDTADLIYAGSAYDTELDYEDFNFFRDLARIYNCELIDFNDAIRKYCEVNDPVIIYGEDGTVHLNTVGYTTIFLPLMKAHFNDTQWQDSLNIPYPSYGKEEKVQLFEAIKLTRFKDSRISFLDIGNWSIATVYAVCSTINEYIDIVAKNIIGLQVMYGNSTADLEILINPGTGLVSPSTLELGSMPLQYASEINSITYPLFDDYATWRLKRPFMKAVVNSNILSDGTLVSGQYKIVVTDIGAVVAVDTASDWVEIAGDWSDIILSAGTIKINGSTGNDGTYTVDTSVYQSGSDRTRITVTGDLTDATVDGYVLQSDDSQYVTCDIQDPASTVLATIRVGFDSASVLAGALEFPLQYNGENNFFITAATLDDWGQPANSNWEVADEYGFYIHNNWRDIVETGNTNKFATVFGFERGDYTIRLKQYNAGTLNLHAIKLIH